MWCWWALDWLLIGQKGREFNIRQKRVAIKNTKAWISQHKKIYSTCKSWQVTWTGLSCFLSWFRTSLAFSLSHFSDVDKQNLEFPTNDESRIVWWRRRRAPNTAMTLYVTSAISQWANVLQSNCPRTRTNHFLSTVVLYLLKENGQYQALTAVTLLPRLNPERCWKMCMGWDGWWWWW